MLISKIHIDSISWKILNELQRNCRVSLKALSTVAGLSMPATSERLKRLEEAGVIDGYRAQVRPESVGYGVESVIGMTALEPDKSRLIELLKTMPEVIECLHVTGQDSYLLRVVSRDIKHLEAFVGSINRYGETRTSIVMSQPIQRRSVSDPSAPQGVS